MAWPINPRPAKSLLVLRDQYDAKYPMRNKDSDGLLGDEAHQKVQSDHNPDANGVVHALDITHDPKHGLDIGVESARLIASNDPRIKYVIANYHIWEPGKGWRLYTGTPDPHTNHMHLSVNTSNGDDPSPWNIEEEDMPERANLRTAQILAETEHGYLGAGNGANADIVKRDFMIPLTNEEILRLYNHPNAIAFRTYRNSVIDFFNKYHVKVESMDNDDPEMQEALAKIKEAQEALQRGLND